MNTLKLFFILVFFMTISLSLFSQEGAYEFSSSEREDGSAFFSLNKKYGQLYYMLDYGVDAGKWIKFGNMIAETGDKNFEFNANERYEGSAFYALESKTGQLYYMLDHGDDAGKWKIYGNTISQTADKNFQFSATERKAGTAFFAIDSKSGKLYFMLDYGDNAGYWKSYGGEIAP